MARVVVSEPASFDQVSILRYLNNKAGSLTARKFNSAFEKVYDLLADFPGMGTQRPKFGKNIRIGVVSSYLVFYRHDKNNNSIVVLRILHSSRNITRKLLKEI